MRERESSPAATSVRATYVPIPVTYPLHTRYSSVTCGYFGTRHVVGSSVGIGDGTAPGQRLTAPRAAGDASRLASSFRHNRQPLTITLLRCAWERGRSGGAAGVERGWSGGGWGADVVVGSQEDTASPRKPAPTHPSSPRLLPPTPTHPHLVSSQIASRAKAR